MKRKLIIDKYMISTSNWVLMETLIFDWLTRQRLHVYTFWRAGNSKIWVWNAACIVFTILRTFTLCISCTVLYCSVHITHLSPKNEMYRKADTCEQSVQVYQHVNWLKKVLRFPLCHLRRYLIYNFNTFPNEFLFQFLKRILYFTTYPGISLWGSFAFYFTALFTHKEYSLTT